MDLCDKHRDDGVRFGSTASKCDAFTPRDDMEQVGAMLFYDMAELEEIVDFFEWSL